MSVNGLCFHVRCSSDADECEFVRVALLFTIVVEVLLGFVLKRKICRLLPNKVADSAQIHIGIHNLQGVIVNLIVQKMY